jgi:hypothetical protein
MTTVNMGCAELIFFAPLSPWHNPNLIQFLGENWEEFGKKKYNQHLTKINENKKKGEIKYV